jgi:hypothetical protein
MQGWLIHQNALRERAKENTNSRSLELRPAPLKTRGKAEARGTSLGMTIGRCSAKAAIVLTCGVQARSSAESAFAERHGYGGRVCLWRASLKTSSGHYVAFPQARLTVDLGGPGVPGKKEGLG